jgi:hypothetical protein
MGFNSGFKGLRIISATCREHRECYIFIIVAECFGRIGGFHDSG